MGATPVSILKEGRRRAHVPAPPPAARLAGGAASSSLSLTALQRSAGNAAVAALLAAKSRPGGNDKVSQIDAALVQAGKAEPELGVLEKGLAAAKEVGVAVDIDGADKKPPASALAVTKTGFGPSTVPAKKPTPPPKPLPPVAPLAKGTKAKPLAKGGKGAQTDK